jgi:hypothetical protein
LGAVEIVENIGIFVAKEEKIGVSPKLVFIL